MATFISVDQLSHSNPPARSAEQPLVARILARPYHLLIRASLALALAGGFGLGLYLVLGFAFGLPLPAATPALMQVHGQVQALGFVALFITAVAAQLFPRFHATILDRPDLISVGGLMLAGGVTLRALTQPLPELPLRGPALLLSALLTLAGLLLIVYAFSRVFRRSVQPEPRRARGLLPATLGLSLLGAVLLNMVAAVGLADGRLVVPFALDEAIVHLELWGFAATMILTVAGRVFPRFLLLQPTRESLVPAALGLWLLGSLGTPLAWLAGGGEPAFRAAAAAAQLTGAVLWVAALRLYDPPARESGTPHVTNPTRRWARSAFGFLLLGAILHLGLALYELAGGQATANLYSAARHALAQGFVLPVIVFMAARILPGYSGLMMRRPRLLAALLWTLLAGALLRVSAQLLGGYGPGWGALVALGGVLAVGAFAVFAVGLWRATGSDPSSAHR